LLRHWLNVFIPNTCYQLCNEITVSVIADIGWSPLFNGYEYLVRRSGGNFNESRNFCKSKGGDLAAAGLRRNDSRK